VAINRIGFHLTFREYPKLATNGSQFGRSEAEPGTRCYRLGLGFVIPESCGTDTALFNLIFFHILPKGKLILPRKVLGELEHFEYQLIHILKYF
jgi:hypothetical protein